MNQLLPSHQHQNHAAMYGFDALPEAQQDFYHTHTPGASQHNHIAAPDFRFPEHARVSHQATEDQGTYAPEQAETSERLTGLRSKAARFLSRIVPRRFASRFEASTERPTAELYTQPQSEADRFAAEAMNHNAEAVWAFKSAPKFSEILATASERNTPLTAHKLSAEPNGIITNHGVRQESEGDTLFELDSFLQDATDVLTYKNAYPATHMEPSYKAEEVAHFRENMTFIGEREFQEAVEGMAAHWETVLRADSQAKIALYQPNIAKHRVLRKSAEHVGDHAFEALKRRTQTDPMLRNRFRRMQDVDPRTFVDGNTKIIIAEDWIASGATIRENVSALAQTLGKAGKPQALENLELNLIVAREDQVASGIKMPPSIGKGRNIPTVAYYQSPAATIYGGPLPTGAHSTEDYGFGQVLQVVGEDVARIQRRPVELPLLADVKPVYRET